MKKTQLISYNDKICINILLTIWMGFLDDH